MAIRDKLRSTLAVSGPMCDDCLSSSAFIKPRQTVNARCRELETAGELVRNTDRCPQCKAIKITNRLLGKTEKPTKPGGGDKKLVISTPDNGKPWYWEGNVQNQIVRHLVSNTATREQGKDIVAVKNGKELWVSVKGWPEKSPNMQARHWFAGALFDLILYKDLNPGVRLAIGIPTGYSTYQNLVGRVLWLRRNLPFEIITVSEHGAVNVLEVPSSSSA
jgi:hypothetical protein